MSRCGNVHRATDGFKFMPELHASILPSMSLLVYILVLCKYVSLTISSGNTVIPKSDIKELLRSADPCSQ